MVLSINLYERKIISKPDSLLFALKLINLISFLKTFFVIINFDKKKSENVDEKNKKL